MKKKIIIFLLVLVAVVAFLLTRINRENLDFSSKYQMLSTSELNEYKDTYMVIVFSTGCSGTALQFPNITDKLRVLKEKNIPYYLVADEIYNDNLDEKLDDLKTQYNLENETFYLMDNKEFPINGGLFNNKERYKNFVKAISNGGTVPLGYVNFISIKNNKIQSFSPTLSIEDINQLK